MKSVLDMNESFFFCKMCIIYDLQERGKLARFDFRFLCFLRFVNVLDSVSKCDD